MVSRDHRCANRRRLTLRDVAGERLIVVDDPPGGALGHRVTELRLEAGFEPASVLRTTDSVGVASFVPAGLWVGIVPACAGLGLKVRCLNRLRWRMSLAKW
ncbi:LysR substrate-binding domain-containing protein [Paraburkholderia sp. CNPSo 3281]|uniref:LysR substrate-binding domain-containing protein n=1 Tax=Paraburkholderia sp. CNPSo 3281 TaxID=2940933 RepID=UPI0035CD13C3